MTDAANSDATSGGTLSARATWLLFLIPLGWFLWSGARGIDFGNHWDEEIQLSLVQESIDDETFLPGWYNYSSISYWLALAALTPELVTSDLSGLDPLNPRESVAAPTPGLRPVQDRLIEATKDPDFLLRTRGVFLCVSSLMLLGVFLASRAKGGPWEALFAAGLLATSFELSYHARWIAPDCILAAFVALFLATLIRLPSGRCNLVCLGLIAGLATGTKYTGGLLLLPIFITWWRQVPERQPRQLARALGAFACTFLITTPGALLQPVRFWRDVAHESSHYSLHHHGFTVEGGLDHLGLNLQWLSMDLGSPYTVLALFISFLTLIGVVSSWRHDRFEAALLLVIPLAWLLFFSSRNVLFVRNLLPIAPFFALFAGRGLSFFANSLPERARPVAAALGACVLVVNGAFAWSASESIRSRGTSDPVVELLTWLETERGDRTVYISEPVARELYALQGGSLPEGCHSTLDSPADLAAFRPGEIALDAETRKERSKAGNLLSNVPGCLEASFGPREVNWEWYTTWQEPRIVVIERAFLETLQRSKPEKD